jgi:tyrosinase
MSFVTRRRFLATAAAIPFSPWLERNLRAQPAPYVRYDARSAEGQMMLKTYADAVQKMKDTPEGDPKGWLFQWYTHWVAPRGSSPDPFDPKHKTEELNRVYPDASPWRMLAEEMWDTCQAHGQDMDENHFLPWHRMFVLYFEQIVRAVSGVQSFTLPYWDYSTSDLQVRGVLPPEFRKKDDPVFGSLYVDKRKRGVNDGQPIQKGHPRDPLSTQSLSECLYEPQGSANGFCMGLDLTLHGNVHVLVGDGTNMGSVPWAAGDPIFWLHHCNIDRLWASWNAAGRLNPSLSQSFTFVDKDGQRVVGNVSDFLDLVKLGYVYDRLEQVPDCPKPREAIVKAAKAQKPVATMSAASVALGDSPVKVTLDPTPTMAGQQALAFSTRVKSLPAGNRFFLIVKDLRAEQQPGVLYDLYLELPADAKDEKRKDYYVGSINFFHAAGHKPHGAQQPQMKGPEKFISFDVTELAKKLHSLNLLAEKATLTIVPSGDPAAEAKPVIGSIQIIEQ